VVLGPRRQVRSYYNAAWGSVKEAKSENERMSRTLPRLRSDIDVMPSPVRDRPGLLLRDPFGYTSAVFVIPPRWIAVLQCLDGERTELDAQALLTRLNDGVIVPGEPIREIVNALREGGFLETEELAALKRAKQETFRSAAVREPSHVGTAYPETEQGIRERFAPHLDASSPPERERNERLPRALAAPHVSPEGGFASYRAAYELDCGDEVPTPTFVILGTSHYGAPERFGVTRKPFRTPLGTSDVDEDLYRELAREGGEGILEEDYCHQPEHSIEFQVLFLQYRLRRPFRILPILCGPFLDSLRNGRKPESVDSNRRFFGALSEIATRRDDLVWVLGVDMAHIGPRYGHDERVRAGSGSMLDVAERDRARLERISAGDAEGFFELVHPDGDDLNWCGYSPFYTFLRAVAPVLELEGELRHYQQWNIDETSVVSFAAMHFHPRGRALP
jgi:AmmeMemoRadiSam system protein B